MAHRRSVLGLALSLCAWVGPIAGQESASVPDTAVEATEARNLYAVLVGVGRYEHLLEKHQLEGPPNDVRFIRDYLTEAGFRAENVVTLADEEGDAPTRVNILAALRRLADRLQPEDFVLVYLAGHGSQQPDTDGDEADGRDEIFLPADTKSWDDAIGVVQNAIADDEISGIVDGYRDRGADVWVVIDSCSSGTMTRGLGEERVRTRNVEPSELGVPGIGATGAAGTANELAAGFGDRMRSAVAPNAGALVQFFAARATEKTPEYPVETDGETGDEEVRGLFTHTLVELLYRHQGLSYAELAQGVVARYRSIPHTSSTPQFYGSMNEPVFGGLERSEAFEARPVDGQDLLKTERAGTLRGFGQGATVAVFAHSGDDTAIATGDVSRAKATEAWIVPKWGEGVTPPARFRAVYLRLLEAAYDPTVRVSSVDLRSQADAHATRRILERLEENGDMPFVEFAHEDPDSDFFAAVFDEKFHLLRRGQTLPCDVRPPGAEAGGDCEREAETFFESSSAGAGSLIRKAAKATNLVRLQGASRMGGGLEFNVEVLRSRRDGSSPLEGEDYLSQEEVGGVLRDGDVVVVSNEDEPKDPWDVWFFWVDSQFGITSLQRAGESVRILGRERLDRRPVAQVGVRTTGEESLVIIAEPVRDGIQPSYRFLEQERHEYVSTRGKAGGASPLAALMEALWASSEVRTRSGRMPSRGFEASVRVLTWTVTRK